MRHSPHVRYSRRRSSPHWLVAAVCWGLTLGTADSGLASEADEVTTPGETLVLAGGNRLPARILRLDHEKQRVAVEVFGRRTEVAAAAIAAEWTPRNVSQRLQRRNVAQDGVLLADGDELYGELVSIDADQVKLRGVFGERTIVRDRLAAIFFRRRTLPAATVNGRVVRVELTGPEERHHLTGVLTSRDEPGDATRIEIQHPHLGRLHIPRSRVRRMETLHTGRRTEIAPHWRHLGNEARRDFDVVPPEGTTLSASFQLDEIPRGAVWLSLRVAALESDAEGARYSDQLATGDLRTNVFLQGEPIDYLNRHVAATDDGPVRIRIRLPSDRLAVGKNRLEFRQSPQRDLPDEFDDCGIGELALEFEDPP